MDPELLFFHHARGKAIRIGKWKLVFNKDGKKHANWELYDLLKDPNETRDLAKQEPDRVLQMAALWEEREKSQSARAK